MFYRVCDMFHSLPLSRATFYITQLLVYLRSPKWHFSLIRDITLLRVLITAIHFNHVMFNTQPFSRQIIQYVFKSLVPLLGLYLNLFHIVTILTLAQRRQWICYSPRDL